MALPMITDGEIEYQHLKSCGLDLTWLQRELQKRDQRSPGRIVCDPRHRRSLLSSVARITNGISNLNECCDPSIRLV